MQEGSQVTPGGWHLPLTPRGVRPGEEQISGGKIQTLVSDMVSFKRRQPMRTDVLNQVGSPGGSQEDLSPFRGQTVPGAVSWVRVTCAQSQGGSADSEVPGLLLGACL